MPGGERCRLCASDEGLFLEIFARLPDRTLHQELEDCLSVKVQKNNPLSTKICHKCVFELGQCNEFISKYNNARKLVECYEESQLRKLCCLCSEPGKKGFLFDLARDTQSPNNPLQKINECFKSDLAESQATNLMICLPCRYKLDVLYDLKNLSHDATAKLERINQNEVIAAELPKTETFVVNRITTLVRSTKLVLHTPSDSDSDSTTMARGKSRPKKLNGSKSPVKVKFRTCGKCQSSIDNGIDMYRFHRTGLTVCKPCWITMDPPKIGKDRKRKRQNSSDQKSTKLCAVFLKDVLTNASFKDDRIYKVEKDEHGNSIYIVTDDNSETDEQPLKKLRTDRKEFGSVSQVSGDDSDVMRNPPQCQKRDADHDSTDNEARGSKRLKSSAPQSDTQAVKSGKSPSSPTARLGTKKENASERSHSAVPLVRITRSISVDSKSSTKSMLKMHVKREVVSGSESTRVRSGKAIDNRKKSRATKSHNEDSSSSEDGIRRRSRRLGDGVQLEIPIKFPKIEPISQVPENEGRSRIGTRSNSDSNKERTPTPEKAEFKSPTHKNVKNVVKPPMSPPGKVKSEANEAVKSKTANYSLKGKKPFVCKVCNTIYRNTLVGMIHELRHFNHLEIKLEHVNVDVELQKLNENALKPNSEEQSHDVSSTSDASHTSDKAAEALKMKVSNLASAVDSDLTHVSDSEPETIPRSRVGLSLSKKKPTKEDTNKDTKILRNGEESSSKVEGSVDNLKPCDIDTRTNTVTDLSERVTRIAKIKTSNSENVKQEETSNQDKIEKDTEKTDLNSDPHLVKGEDCDVASFDSAPKPDEDTEKTELDSDSYLVKVEDRDVANFDSALKPDEVEDAASESSSAGTLRLEETEKDKEDDAAVTDQKQRDKVSDAETDQVEEGTEKHTAANEDDIAQKDTAADRDAALEKDAADEDTSSKKDVVEEKDTVKKDDAVEELIEDATKIGEENDSTAEVESETDIKIVDSGSLENSIEQSEFLQSKTDALIDQVKELPDDNEEAAELMLVDDPALKSNSKEDPDKDTLENQALSQLKDTSDEVGKSKKNLGEDSTNAATEILEKVFDMASAAIEKRTESAKPSSSALDIPETVESISKEINSYIDKTRVKGVSDDLKNETDPAPINADMPSLDPIVEADAAGQLQQFSSNM